jgi:hypothetical protein
MAGRDRSVDAAVVKVVQGADGNDEEKEDGDRAEAHRALPFRGWTLQVAPYAKAKQARSFVKVPEVEFHVPPFSDEP